jgi:hypothetical protein
VSSSLIFSAALGDTLIMDSLLVKNPWNRLPVDYTRPFRSGP